MFTAHDMKPSVVVYHAVHTFKIASVIPVDAPRNGESLESTVNRSKWRLTSGDKTVHEGTFAECVKIVAATEMLGVDFWGWEYTYTDSARSKGRVDLEGEAQDMFFKMAKKS
jgi:hypothetical protein